MVSTWCWIVAVKLPFCLGSLGFFSPTKNGGFLGGQKWEGEKIPGFGGEFNYTKRNVWGGVFCAGENKNAVPPPERKEKKNSRCERKWGG